MTDLDFTQKANLTLTFIIWMFSGLGCGLFSYETKTVEIVRGRLKYVQVLEFREAGTHSDKGWVLKSKQFYVNDQRWLLQPNFDSCTASPNEKVEIFKCFYFMDGLKKDFLVRMKGDEVEEKTVVITDNRKDDSGEWTSIEEGNRLIYKDFFYNAATDEKSEIKGLPDYPEKHFRAVSPDFETVVYEGSCFYGFYEAPPEIKSKREKVCEEAKNDGAKKLITLWLIETKSGETKIIKINRGKYEWLLCNQEKFERRDDWLKFFQQNLLWEKDKNGKYQLVSPNEEGK